MNLINGPAKIRISKWFIQLQEKKNNCVFESGRGPICHITLADFMMINPSIPLLDNFND
jgi:hypothetical protein